MTWAGAFELFYGDTTFTHISRTIGGIDQTTGARIPGSSSEVQVRGALDPMTEDDLRAYGIPMHREGQFRFFTEQSYGIKPQDLIKDDQGRVFRVIQLMNTAPIVNRVMGPTADAVGYHCELTREDDS